MPGAEPAAKRRGGTLADQARSASERSRPEDRAANVASGFRAWIDPGPCALVLSELAGSMGTLDATASRCIGAGLQKVPPGHASERICRASHRRTEGRRSSDGSGESVECSACDRAGARLGDSRQRPGFRVGCCLLGGLELLGAHVGNSRRHPRGVDGLQTLAKEVLRIGLELGLIHPNDADTVRLVEVNLIVGHYWISSAEVGATSYEYCRSFLPAAFVPRAGFTR